MRRPGNRGFFVAFLLVSLLVAGVASYYASSHPDGLMHVAQTTGFIDAEKPHPASDSPFAGYTTTGVDDGRLSGGLAGVVGVAVILGLSTTLFWLLRRRSASHAASHAASRAASHPDTHEDEDEHEHADSGADGRG